MIIVSIKMKLFEFLEKLNMKMQIKIQMFCSKTILSMKLR